jgi:hypothetical protein
MPDPRKIDSVLRTAVALAFYYRNPSFWIYLFIWQQSLYLVLATFVV